MHGAGERIKTVGSAGRCSTGDAVDEQRSVIADIARLGLPHDVASQREARMRAQSSRLANPNAKAVLKRFSDDKEASRHDSPHLTCTDECCS